MALIRVDREMLLTEFFSIRIIPPPLLPVFSWNCRNFAPYFTVYPLPSRQAPLALL